MFMQLHPGTVELPRTSNRKAFLFERTDPNTMASVHEH